ncbi:MAG: hypothetical protein AB8F74_10090 [Saprospiraceae bacterium]
MISKSNHLFILLLFLTMVFSACSRKTTERRFKLPPVLKEVSGLYLESPQQFWWLNDGGDAAALYITDGRGEMMDTILFENLKNRDWEDLTNDDSGNIYIGDFGNNRNQRKDLRIYIYNKNTTAIDSIIFKYPDQNQFPPFSKNWNYDMEAFLWHNNELHLFSKNRIGQGNYYCKHYSLSDQPGEQTAVLKDSIYLKRRVVTAAAISPDNETVALLAYDYKKLLGIFPFSRASIFYFTDFEEANFFRGKIRKRRAPTFIIATQFESLDFLSNKKLFVASEKTIFIKPKAKRVKVRP